MRVPGELLLGQKLAGVHRKNDNQRHVGDLPIGLTRFFFFFYLSFGHAANHE